MICSVGQDARGAVAVAGADNGLDLSGFEAVFVVVADEQARRGDGDGAELVQREDGQPELVVALEHEHHAVAPRDAERGEIIGRAVGEGGDLSEREVALLLVVGKPEHRALVGTFARERVYDVVAEVEILRRQQLDAGQAAVFVDFLADEVVVDQAGVFLGRRLRVCRGRHGRRLVGQLAGLAFRLEHHREEGAVPAARGDHPVRMRGVVEHAVARAEQFDVIVKLHLQRAGQHHIELLSGVGGQRNRRRLLRRVVGRGDDERLGRAVLELGGQMAVIEARAALDRHALAGAGEGVERQLGVVSADERGNIQIERLGALVQEGEGVILRALLHFQIRFLAHPRAGGQLRGALVRGHSRAAQPRGDLAGFGVQIVHSSVAFFLEFCSKKGFISTKR